MFWISYSVPPRFLKGVLCSFIFQLQVLLHYSMHKLNQWILHSKTFYWLEIFNYFDARIYVCVYNAWRDTVNNATFTYLMIQNTIVSCLFEATFFFVNVLASACCWLLLITIFLFLQHWSANYQLKMLFGSCIFFF